ncbi:KpsF/GutQ family sugar-phosphate isomerase [Photobacterium lipolyticum]|uniref:Arabinose 5-phosphate isomerase n=1 Tax=Photobacterium lipolyticum TaxID=266810 RepID=A0A2T3N2F6_9GAMM|nr:KpsF/GutQ family sugar-phosphate isomerase [Photobacterium lipolyticum]PSW06557.1 KpsF/GutQ family sugar-phosphate isomerase [Photobacterium lipolyticum]
MNLLGTAKDVIQAEINGLQSMADNLGDDFTQAVDMILTTEGRTIVCGMGKSGIIGKKIAASLASTGTPGFFMHPAEAFHGDLGMVKSEDVFIAISNSGETDEVLKLLPFLRENSNQIIAITGKPESTLARNSHCHLNIAVPQEACPLQLAPTTSTTATLVMGDALTVTLMQARQFRPENFARFHPGGSLGRRLLGRVSDDMITENLPTVSRQTPLVEVISVISTGQLGLVLVVEDQEAVERQEIVGMITDGDLRRAIERHQKEIFALDASSICSPSPVTTTPDTSIHAALELMEERKISSLVVCEQGQLVGILKK